MQQLLSLSIASALFIWVKSLNSFHTVEQTQEIVLQGLNTLFARLTRDTKPYRTGPFLWNNLPAPIKKMNNLSTFKNNVKEPCVNQ